MIEKQFDQGDVIIREGEYGDSFFQILSGTAAVTVQEGTSDEKKLTELHAGDYFGEMAMLEGYARSATVKAMENGTTVCEIAGSELTSYFEEQPDRILALMRHLSSRLRQLTLDQQEAAGILDSVRTKGVAGQSSSIISRIKAFIEDAGRKLASPVAEETLKKINAPHDKGSADRVNTFPSGTVLFREGDEANCMFDIHWGKVGIYTGYGTAEQHLLTDLYQNRFFGEMGMIDKEPRSATAVVLEDDTVLETIYPEDLEELFRENPPKVEMILRNLSFRLRRLTDDYISTCRKLAETVTEG